MAMIATDNAHYADIASAIPAKNGATDTYKPSEMAVAIKAIKTGPTPGEPLDPVEVYKYTRPSDWLPMPTPNDNEMYLLFHIPDGVSSLLAFTVTCIGNYTVALGTVRDGAFVQFSSTSIASKSKYEAELFADDFGDLTSAGMKQVMVKVSGADILTWEPSIHSKKLSPSHFAGWNIVDISCRLPSGTGVQCGNTIDRALKNLVYFSWHGTNNVTNMYNMFSNCYSLISIPALDTSSVTNMNYMFNNCCSLASIPALDTSSVTNMSYMFNNCCSLTSIPALDTSSVTNMGNMFFCCYSLASIPALDTSSVTIMNSMFNKCYSLTSIPALDTSMVTGMAQMFRSCYSLISIPPLDTSSVTNMSGMFIDCYYLSDVRLVPTVSGWPGYAISLKDSSLGHTAIVAFLNSLPTITSEKAITLTGNPGVSELTDAEKAIATDKGWTLTL